MKKLPIVSFFLIFCIILCSCGKSEEAQKVDDLILDIGNITLASNKKITKAEDAVVVLKEADYKQLDNLDILKEARKTYTELQITELENIIDSIGTNIVASEDSIKKARILYDTIDTETKKQIKNYNKLQDAEKELKSIKTATMKKQQEEIIPKMRIDKDAVTGVTWYFHSTSPINANTRSYVLPYIGEQNGTPFLYLRLHYTGDNWIFFDKVIFSVDGKNTDKTLNYHNIIRDHYTTVWETADIVLTNKDVELLKSIVSSNQTIVRFQGKNYYYDLTINNSDKNAIQDVLLLYEAMKYNQS